MADLQANRRTYKVSLADHTVDPVARIGLYAGECYAAKRTVEACIKRAQKCMEDGHLSTLRFAYATFHIEDISRVCLAQLTRHVHLSYLVKSQRYVDESEATFAVPSDWESLPAIARESIDRHLANSQKLYQLLRAEGIRKEDARFVLPQAVTTSLYVTGNFQAWKDFLRLRTDKHAQAEIRGVALDIQHHLHTIAPQLFGATHE
jgi:thymidylate synthase (FAD)